MKKKIEKDLNDVDFSKVRTLLEKLADLEMPLGKVKKIIEELIVECGEDSILISDAGYNNVEFLINHRRRLDTRR